MYIKGTLLLLTFLLFTAAHSTEMRLPKPGSTLYKTVSVSNANEFFTIRIPPAYNPHNKHPVLVIFSPTGNGRGPTDLFSSVTDQHGWIIISSDSSRNGRDPTSTFRAIEIELEKRLAVDPRRIYVSGMSGGSRVALSFAASRKDGVRGLVQCAAAQVNSIDHTTLPGKDTVFIQCIGSTDYNYPEIIRYAAEAKLANRIVRTYDFEGGHHWPPQPIANAAITHCELIAAASTQRMDSKKKKGLIVLEMINLYERSKNPLHTQQVRTWSTIDNTLFKKSEFKRLVKKLGVDHGEHSAWVAWEKLPYLLNDNPEEYRKTGSACIALIKSHPHTAAATRSRWMLNTIVQRMSQYSKINTRHQQTYLALEQSFKEKIAALPKTQIKP